MIGLATAIVTVLFAGVWQGVVIGAAVLGLLAVFPRATAATKHVILWCGFLAIVVVPLVTVVPQLAHAPVAAGSVSAYSGAALGNVSTDDAPSQSRARVTIELGVAAFALVALWMIGTVIQSIRLTVNLARVSQIRRAAREVDRRNGTPICISETIAVPIAAGLLEPAVIIPAALWDEISKADLDCILLHEMAHISRADGWSKLVQLVLQTILFFNPALIALGRRLAIEREVACDDIAASGATERERFARCIVDLAERVSLAPASALGALGMRNATTLRIRHLLNACHDGRHFVSRPLIGGVLMLLASIALAIQTLAPVVAFATPTVPVAPVAAHAAVPQRAPVALTPRQRRAIVKAMNAPVPLNMVRIFRFANEPSYRTKVLAPAYLRVLRQSAGASAAPVAAVGPANAIARVAPPAVASCTRPAEVIQPAMPVFPAAARAAASPREVVVAVNISATGAVLGTKVVKSSGRADLDSAVTNAARASTYAPAVANCKPVAGGIYGFYARFK